MSLVLMSAMLFLLENVFQRKSSQKQCNFSSKQIYEKLKIFMLISDILFLAALSFRFFLSRVEPLLLLLMANADEISSVKGLIAVLDSIESGLTFTVTPVDLSLTLVVFLAYFGVAIAPGVLCAYTVFIESPTISQHRDTDSSGAEKPPEIRYGGKLFLKLCHLLN